MPRREQALAMGAPMPRITAAHEQEVRDRIVTAALRVFHERGYRRSTVQDVVRESGLSVGAIYTYFRSKDELFLASCDLMSGRGLGELATRLAEGATTAERLAIAVAFFLDTVDEYEGAPGQVTLVQAWAEAEQEQSVREMLVRRREQLVGAAQLLLGEGIGRGELPRWIDVDAVARGWIALLDGLTLQRIEAGEAYRREDAERRALVVLELLLAAAGSDRPALSQGPARSSSEPDTALRPGAAARGASGDSPSAGDAGADGTG